MDDTDAAAIAAILSGDDAADVPDVPAGDAPGAEPAPIEGWWQRSVDVLDDAPELDVELERTFVEAPQPPQLVLPLLPFQRESLTWMVAQERSAYRGGILADEMGLGKTIQTIALLLVNRDDDDAVGAAAAPLSGGPPPRPRAYESEGAARLRKEADKVAAKAAAKDARAAKAAAAKAEREWERLVRESDRAIAKEERELAKAAAGELTRATGGRAGAGVASAQKAAAAAAAPAESPATVATAPTAAVSASPASAATAATPSVPAASPAGSPPAAAAAPAASSAPAPSATPWQPLRDTSTPLDHLTGEGSQPCRATLVVCPVVAMSQWRAEIARHTTPGALRVVTYHGAGRTTEIDELRCADVVLTSYSVLEAEFRKMIAPTKDACRWCKKLFLPEKLRIHQKYFCGPDARKTAAQARQVRTRAPAAASRGGGGGGDSDDDEDVVDGAEDDSSDDSSDDDSGDGGRRGRGRGAAAAAAAAGGGGGKHKSSPGVSVKGGRGGKRAAAAVVADSDDDDGNGGDAGATWLGARGGAGDGDDGAIAAASASAAPSTRKAPSSAAPAGGTKAAAAGKATAAAATPAAGGPRRLLVVTASSTRRLVSKGSGAPPPPPPPPPSATGSGGGAGGDTESSARAPTPAARVAAATSAASKSKPGKSARPAKTAKAAKGGKGGASASGAAARPQKSRRRAGGSDDDDDDDDDEDSSDSSGDSEYRVEDDADEAAAAVAAGDDAIAINSSGDSSDDNDDSDVVIVEDGDDGGGGAAASAAAPPRRRAAVGLGRKSAGGVAPAPPRRAMRLGPLSLLQRVHWRRVVLDEAHCIKNKRAGTSRAAFNLTAERRWCLSGTPLQNRVGELFSLIRFLRVAPYAHYHCKNCPCSSLDYKMDSNGRYCEICGHSPLRHYQWMGRHVLNEIRKWGYAGPGRDAMLTLRREVLGGLLLRRTKVGRAADLALPSRLITVRDDLTMDEVEEDFYEALYTQSKAKFGAYVTAGTLVSNYAIVFDLLTRLRQACDHPYLVLYGVNAEASAAAAAAAGGGPSGVCGICRDAAERAVVTACRHTFCRSCIADYIAGFGGQAAQGMLRDLTVDEAAIVGEEEGGGGDDGDGEGGGDGEGDDNDVDDDDDDGVGSGGDGAPSGAAAKRKRPAAAKSQKPKAPAAKKAKAKPSAGGGDAGPAPRCPTCLSPLSVDLTATRETAARAQRQQQLLGDGAASPAAVAAATATPAPASRRSTILSRLPADRVGAGFRSSTKIEALLEELAAAAAETPGAKALVFSQFTSMLDLVEHRLTAAGVRCVKLDGSMPVPARDRVIAAFREDPGIAVFLISLKAGGFALNLISANYVFLMDAWWNPAAEFQAIDRAHRLGQHRAMKVVRFVVRDSIEERILALQSKKQLVLDATVGADNAALARLTADDLRFLFD